MSWFAAFHWAWLTAGLLLGFGMGWIAVVQRGEGLSKITRRWLAVIAVILVAVALARILPGRPGYWLDLGLALFAVYLVGCAAGSWLRYRVISRHTSP